MQQRAERARNRTLSRLAELGFPAPPVHLPVLADEEFPFALRPNDEVIGRVLVLNVRINLAFGMPAEVARQWLGSNGLTPYLTQSESELVGGARRSAEHEKLQIEGLWALTWALGLTPELDHRAYCGEQLAALLPDLRVAEPSREWTSRVNPRLRPIDEIWDELDLLYAMTWAVAEANLTAASVPGTIDQYVYWERRRALEFVHIAGDTSHNGWDDIDLST